jgi:predicted ATPase/DNA-binding SARP family transcriptional activator
MVDTRKAIALLAYLAMTRQAHSRQKLAALLWTENTPSQARAALRRTLSALRKGLGGEWLDIAEDSICLKLDGECWLDTAVFYHHLHAPQEHLKAGTCHEPDLCSTCLAHLAAAVELYRGEFLAELHVRDCSQFDDWRFFEGENLRRQQAAALASLLNCHQAQGSLELAIGYGQRWLQLDPFQEESHHRLMQLYYQAGEYRAALRQYDQWAAVLAEKVGARPSDEMLQLHNRILRESIGELRPVAPGDSSRPVEQEAIKYPTPPHTLPAQLTPFVGRAEELGELLRYFDVPTCRLLTVMGPGGVGKTRLAIQAGQELLNKRTEMVRHGIYFAPLAAIQSAEFLVSAVATCLNFSFYEKEEPRIQLLRYLKNKRLLLIMDNFEHLLSYADFLLEILSQAPYVRILVTSRTALNFQAESLYELRGLSYPPKTNAKTALTPYADSQRYDAVQLFIQRARRIHISFSPTADDQVAIIQICRLLEGNPLSIELAATLTHFFSCSEIVGQIEKSLDVLKSSMRDMPDRHLSLRAVFEHSWQLLTGSEKHTFARLSVLQGSFSKEAAIQIGDASPALLAALVNKSLLWETPGGRYGCHEILRQYAREKLEVDAAETQRVLARHAAYYATFLQSKEEALKGVQQKATLEAIGREIENVRIGWQYALSQEQYETLHQFLDSLYAFYDVRGWFQEGSEIFERAVEHLIKWDNAVPDKTMLRGQLLARLGGLLHRLSRYKEAKAKLQEGLAIGRQLALVEEVTFCLNQLGVVAYFQGEYQAAENYLQESLTRARESNQLWHEAFALNSLGNVYNVLGQYDQARTLMQQGLTIRQQIGDRRGVAISLNNLGTVAETLGSYPAARQFFQKSLEIKREVNDPRGIALALLNLGYVTSRLGDLPAAKRYLQESLLTFSEIGDSTGVLFALTNLGNLAFTQQEMGEAQNLYENALALAGEIGNQRVTILVLNDLGNVAQAQDNVRQAGYYYQEALALARATRMTPLAIEALVGIAAILDPDREPMKAAELLAFALHHSATDKETREKAEQTLAQVAARLPAKSLDRLHQQAATRQIDELADMLAAV